VENELQGIPYGARTAYAGRIDTAAHEALIADAEMYTARMRAVYDHLIVALGYEPTKADEAPLPDGWHDKFTCPHGMCSATDCCSDTFDIARGVWRWGLVGKRAQVAPRRLSVGTFPATRSIYIKIINNISLANYAMPHILTRGRRQPLSAMDSFVTKSYVRRVFLHMHASEVLCARFTHLLAVLPVPRPPRELVVIPKMQKCAFGYTYLDASHTTTVHVPCTFDAPVRMEAHGGKHSCARHAAIPTGWIDYSRIQKHQVSVYVESVHCIRYETAQSRMTRDRHDAVVVAANRSRITARRRERMARGISQVERWRKMARRGMAARGLNDTRLVEYIIAMAEDAQQQDPR